MLIVVYRHRRRVVSFTLRKAVLSSKYLGRAIEFFYKHRNFSLFFDFPLIMLQSVRCLIFKKVEECNVRSKYFFTLSCLPVVVFRHRRRIKHEPISSVKSYMLDSNFMSKAYFFVVCFHFLVLYFCMS